MRLRISPLKSPLLRYVSLCSYQEGPRCRARGLNVSEWPGLRLPQIGRTKNEETGGRTGRRLVAAVQRSLPSQVLDLATGSGDVASTATPVVTS